LVIFNIKINGVRQFYVDTITKDLVFRGKITGGSMNINNRLYISNSGDLTSYGMIVSIGMMDETTYSYKTEIDGGRIRTNSLFVRPMRPTGEFSPLTSGYVSVNALEVFGTPDGNTVGFRLDIFGELTCPLINGGVPITGHNYNSGTFKFPPATHTHSQYASSTHSHTISDISNLSSRLSSIESRISALES
jgi:hypothetical protein